MKHIKNKKYLIAIISVLLLTVGSFCGLIVQFIPAHAADDNALFENIGHYAFATAGSNNNTIGTGDVYAAWDTTSFINNYPANWASLVSSLNNAGIYNVTNITGSYLKAPGKAKKVLFSWIAYSVFIPNGPQTYNGRVLIIKPDNSFFILNLSNHAGNIDITNYLNADNIEGWYYVSFLDAMLAPQNSWSMLAAYENNSLPVKYIKLINSNVGLTGDPAYNANSYEINLNSKLKLKNNFQLVGVITGGGISAWPLAGETEDRAWAVLEDGSYKQLYQQSYNGRDVFAGRSNTDFANGTFNTIRTTNLKGGEMDIWDETFSKDFFNGKGMVGYRFQKDGFNAYYISALGLTQEIEIPNLIVTPELDNTNPDNTVKSTITVKNTSQINSCSTKLDVVLDEKLTTVDNLQVVVKDSNGNVVNLPTSNNYDNQTKKLTISFNGLFRVGYTATVTYSSVETTSTKNKIDLDPVVTYFPATDEQCIAEVINSNVFKQEATNHTETPIPVRITTNHYIYGTKTSLKDSTSVTMNKGNNYTTSSADIPNYSFVTNDGDPVNGVAIKENIVVNYYYKNIVLGVDPEITKKGDDLIVDKNQLVNYQINYNAEIKDYYGSATVTIIDTLPYRIDVVNSILDGGIYDDDTKTISWIETIDRIDSYATNGVANLNYQKNISLKYFAGEYQNSDKHLSNKVVGTIQAGSVKIDRETNFTTDIKIPAKIIINHYLNGTTTKIADTETYDSTIGESYTTTPNNELLKKYNVTYPDNANGVIDNETIEVNYYYELIKNPNTKDYVTMYLLTFLLSLMALTVLITKHKELN